MMLQQQDVKIDFAVRRQIAGQHATEYTGAWGTRQLMYTPSLMPGCRGTDVT
jgi:hypothetical protein